MRHLTGVTRLLAVSAIVLTVGGTAARAAGTYYDGTVAAPSVPGLLLQADQALDRGDIPQAKQAIAIALATEQPRGYVPPGGPQWSPQSTTPDYWVPRGSG